MGRDVHINTQASSGRRSSGRTIRSAVLIGYRETAASVGLDANEMLRQVGLNLACDEEYDNRIKLDAYLALLAISADRAKCGDFGARVATKAGLPDYGPVSLIMREAETLQEALEYCSKYFWIHCKEIYISLEKQSSRPFIRLEMPGSSVAELSQVTQFGVVGVTTQLNWLTGGHFRPKLISFAFPRPSNAISISQIIGCEIAYNQNHSGIVFEPDMLTRSVVTSDPSMRRIALRQFAHILADCDGCFVADVHKGVRYLLSIGECSSERVAARFQMDQRTLNRRLRREGLTFLSIVQQVRTQLAIQALDSEHLTITQIANLVGFSDVSSFSRWFRATFKCSARHWRQSRRSHPDDGEALQH